MGRWDDVGHVINGVTVFDEYVFGEESYVSPPPSAFDGPGGLPVGWSRLTVPIHGRQHKGFMSDMVAVLPTGTGEWYICTAAGGVIGRAVQGIPHFDDHVAAIVAAEMMFPRR